MYIPESRIYQIPKCIDTWLGRWEIYREKMWGLGNLGWVVLRKINKGPNTNGRQGAMLHGRRNGDETA